MENSSPFPHLDVLYVIGKDGSKELRPRIVFLMAFACAISVANLYWVQPLLDTIAHDFGASTTTAGLSVTFTQFGYVLGLVFIVPLGDLLERKRLIISISILTTIALIVAAVSPTIHFFLGALMLVGLASVVVQILVPFAATLAGDHERGKVVGQVMGGLLLGILFARTLSGFIADLAGWRAVFGSAAVLMLIVTLVLAKSLPRYKHNLSLSYHRLLLSVLDLIRKERSLRIRSIYGGLVFANFGVFWTSITFLLAGPPFHYSDALIGLFGLVGAAGALSATIAGRLTDRGFASTTTIIFVLLNLISFLLMLPGSNAVVFIIVGDVLLDAGVQGTHITNQSIIYRLSPEARSRITTAYMTAYFIGGTIGSALSAALYPSYGWTGVCFLGIVFSVLAVGLWVYEKFIL